MLQFLRLHPRTYDFVQTVAKARRFAETQEAVKPKKSVRIVEALDKDHNADAETKGQPNFQPLLDGFQQVIQTVLTEKTQIASVTSVPSENDKFRRRDSSNRSPSPAPNNRSSQPRNSTKKEDTRQPPGQQRQQRQDGFSVDRSSRGSSNGNRFYDERNGRASPSPSRSYSSRNDSQGQWSNNRPPNSGSGSYRNPGRQFDYQNGRGDRQYQPQNQWYNRGYSRSPRGSAYEGQVEDRMGRGIVHQVRDDTHPRLIKDHHLLVRTKDRTIHRRLQATGLEVR